MRKSLLLGAAAVTMIAGAAFAQMAPTKAGDSAKGKVLTSENGMTLYVFDKDSAGKSACNGPCAANWPPLAASASSKPMGHYTIITRDDGSSSGLTRAGRYTIGKMTRSLGTSPATASSMALGT